MNSLTELDRKSLQSLIERAQAIHNKLNDEIESSISFCKVCSERGRYRDVAETSFPDRERLIAIRNSLNEVENMLVYLQSWQLRYRQASFTCFGRSRMYLMEQVTGYQGRELDVVNEVTACFGNEKSAFNSNSKNQKNASPSVPNGKRRIVSFAISCIGFHFDPRKWQKAVGIAAKLIMVCASISSTIQFYHSRQKYCNSQRKILSVDSTDARAANNTSKTTLDVFSVRG